MRSRLWRVDDEAAIAHVQAALADEQLLIADGHHRYETALAFHEQDGTEASAYTFAALVNTRGEGLAIFPTHRVFAKAPELGALAGGRAERRAEAPPSPSSRDCPTRPRRCWSTTPSGARLVASAEPILDVELVDRLGHEGISYTPDWKEAVAAVDSGTG